jgi:hypothetical protein
VLEGLRVRSTLSHCLGCGFTALPTGMLERPLSVPCAQRSFLAAGELRSHFNVPVSNEATSKRCKSD